MKIIKEKLSCKLDANAAWQYLPWL